MLVKNLVKLGLCLPLYLGAVPAFADLTDSLNEGEAPAKATGPKAPAAEPAATRPSPPSRVEAPSPAKQPSAPAEPAASDRPPAKAASKEAPKKREGSRKGEGAGGVQNRLPITWEGEGLSGLRQEGVIELHSKVKVEQGDFRLLADRAKVYFDQTTDEVQRVTATGHVRIFKTDPKTGQQVQAKSEEVEFLEASQTIILTGDAELLRGKHLMKGQFIRYEMNTGQVHAGKVKGVVQPGEGQ